VLVLGQTPGTKCAKKFQVPATWITSVLYSGNDPHSTFEVFEAEQKGALFPSWQ